MNMTNVMNENSITIANQKQMRNLAEACTRIQQQPEKLNLARVLLNPTLTFESDLDPTLTFESDFTIESDFTFESDFSIAE